MSQGHWGLTNTSSASSCFEWKVLIWTALTLTQLCRSFRKGPGKQTCQTQKSRANEDPWIPGIVEWLRSKAGRGLGRAIHHQSLVHVLLLQFKITFLLNIRSIRVGFKLSDKITQRFGAIRAKPVTAESSLIHPDWMKILRVDSCLASGGISLLFHYYFLLMQS